MRPWTDEGRKNEDHRSLIAVPFILHPSKTAFKRAPAPPPTHMGRGAAAV
ncbi:MAG: hypothetical protein ACXW5U_20130 [Thermoanaerobaculia bacterium]